MLGPTQQGLANPKHCGITKICRGADRSSQNLCGRVGISGVQEQLWQELTLKLDFRALRERFIHIHVLSDESYGIRGIVDPVIVQIVEVRGSKRVSVSKEILQDSR